MVKLGLVAGGGGLPLALAASCQQQGRALFVVRLRGFADPGLSAFDGDEASVGEIGRIIRLCHDAGCEALCFAGKVQRPNFSTLRTDLKGMALLPGAIIAARKGDDSLLRYLMRQFELAGFAIEGPHEVMADLTLDVGPIGRYAPQPKHQDDLARALDIARAIGAMDVGQGAVVCDGLVLAVEAQEGTDAMLRRVAELPEGLRGTTSARRGVLAKAPKPIQEERMDLPTIGPATIEHAARAGLAGVVGTAGKVLVVDRAAVIEVADSHGLFVAGVEDGPP